MAASGNGSQLSEPRTANWVRLKRAGHTNSPRVLERLIDDGILHHADSGTQPTDYPDYRPWAMKHAMRLRDSGHTVEEIRGPGSPR